MTHRTPGGRFHRPHPLRRPGNTGTPWPPSFEDQAPVLRVEEEGYTPFWAISAARTFSPSPLNNEHFLNTSNSVLGPDATVRPTSRRSGSTPRPSSTSTATNTPAMWPGQRLVPAAFSGPAPGGHRRHRRQIRGQAPRLGGIFRLRPGDRRALHAPGDHEHLPCARGGRAHHVAAHPGHLRGGRPRVPGRPEGYVDVDGRHHRPVRPSSPLWPRSDGRIPPMTSPLSSPAGRWAAPAGGDAPPGTTPSLPPPVTTPRSFALRGGLEALRSIRTRLLQDLPVG